ncbi:MAG: hypothetical protein KAR31_00390, partial [Candidatus Omnitrophica bacterium]|nr:hypothetical protein [Candidatus Omnitrophota bacterium]
MARRFVLIPDKHIEATVEFFVDQFEESDFDKGRCITELKQAKRDALIFISRPSSVSSPIKDSIVSLLSGKTEQGLNHKTAHSDRLVKRREFLRIGFGYMTKLSGLGALLSLAEGCAGSAHGRGSKALRRVSIREPEAGSGASSRSTIQLINNLEPVRINVGTIKDKTAAGAWKIPIPGKEYRALFNYEGEKSARALVIFRMKSGEKPLRINRDELLKGTGRTNNNHTYWIQYVCGHIVFVPIDKILIFNRKLEA